MKGNEEIIWDSQTVKLFFTWYYKYCFFFKDEQSVEYTLDDQYCNSGDIYRFSCDYENIANIKDGVVTLDGLQLSRKTQSSD